MRIAAKHLRYTMEAFGKLYDTTFQDRIATVRDLQDRLGELHDCDVWIGMLQARSVNDPGLDALLHDRMEVRIGGYGEVVKTWEKLIDEEFFTDLLGSIVPDVSPALPQEGGMTKREQLKAVIRGCGVDEEHSLHVAELSLMLFDGLRSLHRLDDEKRDLLEYAGLLHDIGWKEGQRNHHKTSLEMIMTDDGLPFDEKERSIIANVARYHRGVIPNGDHKAYMDLKAGDRRVVDRLAAIIRVADALDVSHTSVVKSAVCQVKKGKVIVLMATTGHPDRELEKAHEKKDLFEKTFKRTLLFEWESS